MSVYLKMFTSSNFVFEGLNGLLDEVISNYDAEELLSEMTKLKVGFGSAGQSSTSAEIRKFISVLGEDDIRDRAIACMPVIVNALVEAEDRNALILIAENSNVCGELPEDAKSIIDRYEQYRDKAIVVFAQHTVNGTISDFNVETDGIRVFFEQGALFFKPKDRVAYRVFRFDN